MNDFDKQYRMWLLKQDIGDAFVALGWFVAFILTLIFMA